MSRGLELESSLNLKRLLPLSRPLLLSVLSQRSSITQQYSFWSLI